MLHEILLSLSGQPSPLLDLELEPNGASSGPFPLLSPPEKALLASLARLSRLHASLRTHTARISSSHNSTVCRAVSSAISIEGLGKFQKQILNVERAILCNDSHYVGGYGIVPLSTLVTEFSPWIRRLEWLWGVACFILPEAAAKYATTTTTATSGASLIDYLRSESQTGYLDLQEIALQLIKAAETAWMRQLSMWLLYGELPTFGREDFFVQAAEIELEDDELSYPSRRNVDYVLRDDLLPKFVSAPTASSILFIGKSLNHIRSQRNRSTSDNATGSITGITLETDHLRQLSSLKSPISTSLLANAVTAIRLSVSQISLSKLLPLPKIVEILSLIHDFLLLGRGEFVTSLVSNADSRLQARMTRPGGTASGLDGVMIKEGEVAAALAQTWTELYALQSEEAPVDEELDLARELLSLSIQPTKKADRVATPQDNVGTNLTTGISSISFADLLFPTETALSLKIQPPIDLFLSNSDMSVYSTMHSYLLGIRRAQLRLSSLWKHTTMRRLHPSPLGPPRSNTRGGQYHLQSQRQRHNARSVEMRQVWATASASLFVLSEIGGYLQGEVIQESWQHFQSWLQRGVNPTGITSRPASQHESVIPASRLRGSFAQLKQSRPSTANSTAPAVTQQHDPETITVAHRRYLSSLTQSLFLTEVPFTSSLRSFLTSLDHLIALVSRLETVQRNLDLEADEGVVDALADYAKEERTIKDELQEAHEAVQTNIKDIISRLRDIDDNRSVDQGHRNMFEATESGVEDRNMYIPRKAAGVNQLLMKLDFAGLNDNPVFAEDGDDGDEGDVVHDTCMISNNK
ncbi:gamma-tubulin complex component GCP4, putative [Talaromyces stipitatus ATCC 10500]|uniref:Spindle pole body component n=1 Tax=Talaromyces stipitatus (strain ATCC 10500 / CBS 375.48 / QM 6759 / NRRL 1006) TaxID=441959 RepID=B8MQ47_TALSN|nr:gamma-tubulin complex component GCP4, putative [Talaromyces stipitatus ATCC 10500]EED13073.1 gamma-tubulin complex component GCP4, putative [Talaromyces stipitatus ATCC 10500]